jgi:hypothetical protein
MKCRACWTDKAFIRDVSGWRGFLHSWLGIVPLKCHHCYHKFSVPWFSTIGKRLTPPAMTIRSLPVVTGDDEQLLGSSQRSHAESSNKAMRRAA